MNTKIINISEIEALYRDFCKENETVDMVCLTRHNQTSNTGIWHERARQYNFYLRGFKYLFIMKKRN